MCVAAGCSVGLAHDGCHFAQVTLLRPPRPPLLTNFCVWCLCIFSVLLYAGIARAPPASVSSVFLRMVLLDFLGSSLSFRCRTLRFPKNRTRAFHLVCAARCRQLSVEKHETYYFIGKRSVYGMDFQLELGFYSNDSSAALCTLIVCIGLTPETFAQVIVCCR